MKKEIFNTYAKQICLLFRIEEKDLFKKCKERNYVDARYLLYYLCAFRPMRVRDVQEFMRDKKYDVAHTTILHGISQVTNKIKEDRDYLTIVKTLELECIH